MDCSVVYCSVDVDVVAVVVVIVVKCSVVSLEL